MQRPSSFPLHTRPKGSVMLFLFATLILVAFENTFLTAEAEHIAIFTPLGSYSHRISIWGAVQKLVAKGHHVTFISSYHPKDPLPNVTEIVPEQMAKYVNDYMQGGDLDITRRISGDLEACYNHGPRMGLYSCEKFFEDPVVTQWLKTEPQIDLFIVDWFCSECIFGLIHKRKAPLILYAPTVMVSLYYETFGFLPDSASVPDFEHHFSPPMKLWERAINAIQPLIYLHKMKSYHEKLGNLIKEKMNLPDMPPVGDMVKNATLMLWSESIIEGHVHTLPPNWVTVGGMHCQEKTDPLPKDLEKIVQKGKEGFIYISFGSAVVPANLPKGHREAFFSSIKSFPNIQFLWKWTGDMPTETIPKNLYIGNWFPQQDLLAHRKILAFVTQAGRPSTQEAIFHGVPIIAIPVFEDQDYTAERVRDMGGGIALEIATLTEKEFKGAVYQITTDPKYKETMKRLSVLFKDRPMKPVDKAVWWIEYVLRHKGNNLDHLRSPSRHLTWYQRRLLDVWTVFIIGVLLIATIIIYIIVACINFLFCKSHSQETINRNVARKKNQ